MKNLHGILILSVGLAGLGTAAAQDFDVQGDASNGGIVFQAKNINTGASDKIAVQGYSVPQPYYGIGVRGVGGWKGVVGEASAINGTGTRVGVEGGAAGGASNYGVRGTATGGVGTNYGVIGEASGTNSRAGKFVGDLEYTGALLPNSDRRLKKNIRDIRNCVSIVKRLSPKEYDYRVEEYPQMHLNKAHQMGLVAQDVEAVLPELVAESVSEPAPEGKAAKSAAAASAPQLDTYKNLNYMGLIPVLIGALQEQQEQIEALTRKLAQYQK